MNIEISKTKKEAGRIAAKKGARLIREAIEERGKAHIIVATGTSQFEVLDALTTAPGIDWSKVTGFHLDEYEGLPITHPASFRLYLWKRFLSRLPLPMKEFHYINGNGDPHEECERVAKEISQVEIDVAFIGIGENAHIAFNDPPADFETTDPYIVVTLDEACRRQQLDEGWFPALEDVPARAISMSVKEIMRSRCIICAVPDKRKAAAISATLNTGVSPKVPASILLQHDCCHLHLDQAAASYLP